MEGKMLPVITHGMVHKLESIPILKVTVSIINTLSKFIIYMLIALTLITLAV